MEPLVVEVVRGDVVEARHTVHAAVSRNGVVELALGDPTRLAFLRSSAKPFQVLPLVRARPDLDDEQIAVACASHLASPEQLDVVRRLLAAAPATEEELECGPDPTAIRHTCSGKHAGLLALCRARGWAVAGYRHAGHPCQEAMRVEIAAAAEVDPTTMPTAIDGCGILTFALPLERAAHAFARLHALDGGDRVVRALGSHPELLRGPIAADVVAIRSLDGWIAKGGAEGLFCAASPGGLGLALKVDDGSFRAIRPALAEVLRRLGVDPGEIDDVAVENSHGEEVGAYRIR